MNDELYHYGVKGMKWGVRRYQNPDGTRTAAGKKREQSRRSKSNSELTGDGEIAIMFGAYAVAYAAIFATIKGVAKIAEKKGRENKSKELEFLNTNKQIKSFKDAPKLRKKMSPEDSAKVTNPEFPSMGTTMNCTFCTTAMALRERGYDVKAAKLSDGWYSDDLFAKTFNSPEVKMKARTRSDVTNKLSVHGDGAYGNLVVNWKLGGSHSIFWKNENGTTNFYDGQSGKAYRTQADKNMLLDYANLGATKYNRLDNCEPTEYALAVVESNKKK